MPDHTARYSEIIATMPDQRQRQIHLDVLAALRDDEIDYYLNLFRTERDLVTESQDRAINDFSACLGRMQVMMDEGSPALTVQDLLWGDDGLGVMHTSWRYVSHPNTKRPRY